MDAAFAEALRRARPLGLRTSARLWQRWTGTPFRVAGELVPQGARVVDLGCGFGLLAGLLALDDPTRDVRGVDPDAAKIRRAQSLFGDVARFEVGTRLGLGESTAVDCVVCWDMLHHVEDPGDTLRAAAASLRPGGLLVVKENDIEPLGKRAIAEAVELVAVGLNVTRSAPVRFRSRAAWADLLGAAGLVVERNEHLRAREGFFVPHALLVARKPAAPVTGASRDAGPAR